MTHADSAVQRIRDPLRDLFVVDGRSGTSGTSGLLVPQHVEVEELWRAVQDVPHPPRSSPGSVIGG